MRPSPLSVSIGLFSIISIRIGTQIRPVYTKQVSVLLSLMRYKL